MTQMHGENQLKKQTRRRFFIATLECKNLLSFVSHHHINSRQITSGCINIVSKEIDVESFLVNNKVINDCIPYKWHENRNLHPTP